MSNKRTPRRSLDEWMSLVTECRQGGLSDAAWCNENGISPSCFYNAATRLWKKAYQIPDPVEKANTLDLTFHKQDVVRIAITLEHSPAEPIPKGKSFHVPYTVFTTIQFSLCYGIVKLGKLRQNVAFNG